MGYTGKCTSDHVQLGLVKYKILKPAPSEKVAKVASKNRQNRHMAEFCPATVMKVVEHQILSEKLVSQAKFGPPSLIEGL